MKKEEILGKISELQLELRKVEVREQVSSIKTQVDALGLSTEELFEALGEKKAAAPSEQVSEPAPLLYFLRTCVKDGSSYKGTFRWDLRIGAVNTAPDWDPAAECGKGLHGLLAGTGNASLLDCSEDAVWVVFSSPSSVDLNGKHKVQHATVRAVGDRKTATDFLLSLGFQGVHGCFTTAGDYGTAIAGDYGTATAGFYGTAIAGDYSTATAGDYGTAIAGDYGTATAGFYGTIIIKYWDGPRHRSKIGYIGEDGLEPNVKYKLNEKHEVVKA